MINESGHLVTLPPSILSFRHRQRQRRRCLRGRRRLGFSPSWLEGREKFGCVAALHCTALQCAPFSDFFLSMARLFRWFVRSWGSSKSKILSSLNRGLKWFCTGRRRRRLIRECSVMIWFSERFSEKTKNLRLVELHTFWSNFYVWCCCWLTDNLFGPFYKKKQKKKIPSQMKKTVLEVSRGMSR